MRIDAIKRMRCPFCLDSIEVQADFDDREGDVEYGLLGCRGCRFEFPVIGGVAIVMGPGERVDIKNEVSTSTLLPGPSVKELIGLLRARRRIQALARLLGPTHRGGELYPRLTLSAWKERNRRPSYVLDQPPMAQEVKDTPSLDVPGWIRTTGRRLVSSSARLEGFIWRTLRSHAQVRLARFLESRSADLSALDAIAIYYGRYSRSEIHNYFAFRFGQPRHLASLSVAPLLAHTDGPILDLACGAGHVTHYFTSAFPNREAYGIDRDFFRLLLAHRYVAPRADFICASADRPLPFPAQSLGGVFCSDAFHYFLDRAATIRESQRVVGQRGAVIITRFGNGEVSPREGYELTLESYRRLLGDWPNAFLGEDEMLQAYLQMRSPDLEAKAPSESLREQKWLSVVFARDLQALHGGSAFPEWPHALGRLRVNPIYSATDPAESNGDIELLFRFPSEWYAFENQRYLDYAPMRCTISRVDLDRLQRGERSPSIDALIAQCVLIGMPDRYC